MMDAARDQVASELSEALQSVDWQGDTRPLEALALILAGVNEVELERMTRNELGI